MSFNYFSDITQVDKESDTPESTPEKGQKNKKRCYQCKCKLELAQRQIGRCKCGQYLHMYLWLILTGVIMVSKYRCS